MDVTRFLCILGKSTDRYLVNPIISPLLTHYITFDKPNYSISISTSKIIKEESTGYKDTFHKDIGNSIFSNFESIVVANIQVMYDIFSLDKFGIYSNGGSLAPQFLYPKRYPVSLHLNAKSFGLAEYVQFRVPLSFTYINPSIYTNPVDVSKEKERLGPDNISLNGFYDRIKLENPDGIDLIYHSDESNDYNIVNLFKYSNLLKVGGTIVFTINCKTPKYIEYLSLCYHFFKEINLFKPCTIDTFDPYLYVICKGYNPNIEVYNYIAEISDILNHNISKGTIKGENIAITQLIKVIEDPNLVEYVTSVIKQIKELRETILKDGKYFAPRALIYWGLPGTPE